MVSKTQPTFVFLAVKSSSKKKKKSALIVPGIKAHLLNYSSLCRAMFIFRTAIVRVSVAAELRFPFHCTAGKQAVTQL